MWQSLAFRLCAGSMLLIVIFILFGEIADTVRRVDVPELSPAVADIKLIAVNAPEHLIYRATAHSLHVGAVLTLNVSGYTSTVEQTDDTPCIASDTSNICERKRRGESICATSRNIPLGARLHVEGLGTCTVADRKHKRYSEHVDWYFGQDAAGDDALYQRARNIGRRERVVTIVSVPE